MGFVTLGIFTATAEGIQGGIFQMLSHGLISGALFLCVGVLYDRLHTREITRYGGIVKNMPKYATILMILTLGSVGLPGTSGFVGEFLSLLSAFQVDVIVAAFATTGVILGAAYMLRLYRAIIFGPAENKDALSMPDVSMREYALLVPLVALVLWLGVFPSAVMDKTAASVDKLVAQVEAGAGGSPAVSLKGGPEKPSPHPVSLDDVHFD
jgi:NADH-quinone oxidoreductase subunit M